MKKYYVAPSIYTVELENIMQSASSTPLQEGVDQGIFTSPKRIDYLRI